MMNDIESIWPGLDKSFRLSLAGIFGKAESATTVREVEE